MSYFPDKPFRHRVARAQVHFPPLCTDDALLFVQLLERVIQAVWRAHGPEMAQRLSNEAEALLNRGRHKLIVRDNTVPINFRVPRNKNDVPF